MSTKTKGPGPKFAPDILTFQEFVMREPLPLAAMHDAVLEFLVGREDVVVFGAQAVNAYVDEPRMTQGIDLLSPRAAEFAQELRDHLQDKFHVALRIREIGRGKGFRLYQVRKSGNRHLADIRPAESLPATKRIGGVLVLAPVELIASKVVAYSQRRAHPKSGTDWRDLAVLLLAFPDLKRGSGPVSEALQARGADAAALDVWQGLVAQEITAEDADDEGEFS